MANMEKSKFFRNEFVADASYINDLDTFITGEFMPQFGDENLETTRVEETVITPES
jgi:hypothetical protein